ncbi:MAG: NUDIX hydrolase [Nitrososphaerota archaeon]|nr:NUDIX hydrolase [Candidatus Calditenuaceae archaeon]MDW8072643.1 NUDIX hydrolase [Nitrososphaerota archaeon]
MSPLPERVSSERVYEGELVSVTRVRLRYEGEEVVREIVEHPGSVAVVATDREGRFLLVHQYRVGVGEATLEIPAGTLEEGEDPVKCAERELEEETGYRAEGLSLVAVTFPTPGYANERLYIFAGRASEGGAPRREVDEDIRVVRLTRDEVVEAIRRGEIRDLKSIAGLLMSILLNLG